MRREHNAVLQERERRIQDLENRLMQNSSPLGRLEQTLKQQENDRATINHLSQMEAELSEALDEKDQIELKLKTQSAELAALRERHEMAMISSKQIERNSSGLQDEVESLKERLAAAEAYAESLKPKFQPAPPLQEAPSRSPKSGGLFRSGSLLKKKTRAQSEDYTRGVNQPGSRASVSDLSIAPDQFEQYAAARPLTDSLRPAASSDAISITSSTSTLGRTSSLLRRLRHPSRSSRDLSAVASSPSASSTSFADVSDSSPQRSAIRRSVDLSAGRSDIPRPTNRLATIPSGDMISSLATLSETPAPPAVAAHTASSHENAPPRTPSAQSSRLPLPASTGRTTPDVYASSSNIALATSTSTSTSTPSRSTADLHQAQSSSTSPTSPRNLLALRKPAEEREKERYRPSGHGRTDSSNTTATSISASDAVVHSSAAIAATVALGRAQEVDVGVGGGRLEVVTPVGSPKAGSSAGGSAARRSLEHKRQMPTLSLAERQSRAASGGGGGGGGAGGGTK